jgi:hypothetical protein
MKKLLLLVSVVALLALTAVPAMAGGDNNRHRWDGERFGLVGEVTEVDAEAKTITVLVHRGSRLVKDYLGDELLITAVGRTRFLRYAEPKCEPIGFGDVEVGARVGINGYMVTEDGGGEIFQAKLVIVDIPARFLG